MGTKPTVAVGASAVRATGGFGFAAKRSSGVLSVGRWSVGSRGRTSALVVKAAEEGAAEAGEGNADERLAFEPQSKSKSKRKRRTGENTRRAKVSVEGMAIDAAKGVAPVTMQSASEEVRGGLHLHTPRPRPPQ